jgi:hypothetical protein
VRSGGGWEGGTGQCRQQSRDGDEFALEAVLWMRSRTRDAQQPRMASGGDAPTDWCAQTLEKC